MLTSPLFGHFRSLSIMVIAVMALLVACPTLAAPPHQGTTEPTPPVSNPQLELDVIGLLNYWRMNEDLAPFKRNALLDEIALAQARFLSKRRTFPAGFDYHMGPDGGIDSRTLKAGWPTYGSRLYIEVGEIAALYPNAAGAIQFWRGSHWHRLTIRNAVYREIGAAAVRHGDDYVFIVVMGSRPSVLPTMVNPDEGILYLSTELSKELFLNEAYMRPTVSVTLLDENGEPISTRQWTPTMPLPDGDFEWLTIIYSDGENTAESEVDLSEDSADTIILPGQQAPATSTPIITPSATPTTGPTATPTVTLTPSHTPTATLTPTITPTPTPVITLRIIYDGEQLAVMNISGGRLNLRTLSFIYTSGALSSALWEGFSASSLDSFANNGCLRVYSLAASGDNPTAPAGCGNIGAARGVLQPFGRFWLSNGFDVMLNNKVVTTCPQYDEAQGAVVCDVLLP